jgi:RNA 3'-terminal phosphate cyclase-like protein
MVHLMFNENFNFRERIIISIFSKKKIFFKNKGKIFSNRGLKKFELDLLSLIDKMIPKSIIQVNESGSLIIFSPGFLIDSNVRHKTSGLRSLSYFLEFIFYLVLFNNCWIEVNLIGLRALNLDLSIENLLYVTLPLIRKIGKEKIRIKIFTNFFSFLTNIEIVIFSTKSVFKKDFNLLNFGLPKKLRLIFSYSSNFNFSLKSINTLLDFYKDLSKINFRFYFLKIPNKNIYFQTISLIIESSTGCILGKDFTSVKFQKKKFFFLKNKFKELFSSILTEINIGSCIDGHNQVLVLIKMLINGKSDYSSFSIGCLTFKCIRFFRDVKKTFGLTFFILPHREKKTIIIKFI